MACIGLLSLFLVCMHIVICTVTATACAAAIAMVTIAVTATIATSVTALNNYCKCYYH